MKYQRLRKLSPLPSWINIQRSLRDDLRHTLEHLLHIEQPFPVSVRGITLYALWEGKQTLPSPPVEFSQGIAILMDDLGLWTAVSFTWWQPAGEEIETRTMGAREAEQAVLTLHRRLNELYPTPAPAYLIMHIDTLSTPEPRLSFFYRTQFKAAIAQSRIDAQEDFVEHIQRQYELAPRQVSNGWLPNRFRLYDPESKRRGWLVFSPERTLVVGVNEEQARLLANLLQPSDTDRTRGTGILFEHYRDVLSRVMQWVSNQDSFEAVNQLKDLVASGTQAIDGQVMLNFAVAGIGILLAFLLLPDQKQPERLIACMVCLAIASFWFWLYARSGRATFNRIGWLFFLAVLLCLFLWPQLIALYNALAGAFH